jgi:hypothetical protein
MAWVAAAADCAGLVSGGEQSMMLMNAVVLLSVFAAVGIGFWRLYMIALQNEGWRDEK